MAAETPKLATTVATPIAPRTSIAPGVAGPTTSILTKPLILNYILPFLV
jgi:hypothetical protein